MMSLFIVIGGKEGNDVWLEQRDSDLYPDVLKDDWVIRFELK